ncbi:class I SAM-dependent methyltransferase [Streptomyces zingiberis]|uniref:Class I SAM-dependent methyltransferase n=1 Tax=Streptomyces zingiberis TaxID=2053010 RepID=A0ABX1BSZ6_9ACTN|nr:class I SAM-dependent methyltransferase [Streptomyces zingiberis]NJP99577.1 class I SAM-dependent methyltransferase [Streptomyces zingiberis]
MVVVAGTVGYGPAAEIFALQYESISFQEVHGEVLPLFPPPPARVADLGAGSGRDAAGLTALGYHVVAVEPTPELREIGQQLHAESPIRWIDDALPHLSGLHGPFDLILIVAVWMHLEPEEREAAMRRLRSLLAPRGRAVITLRHGPLPSGRRMFDVPISEVLSLGRAVGLDVTAVISQPDLQGRADVNWSVVVLQALPPQGAGVTGEWTAPFRRAGR